MGQTLGAYGVGGGCYFVLPVLGPTTVRDSIGLLADTIIDPFAHITIREHELLGASGNALDYYSVKRLCFSLKTKSYSSALRITKSVLQRLEDYWLGIRLQKMDIPAIHLVKSENKNDDSSPLISDALEFVV